jgi:hypothetical protein
LLASDIGSWIPSVADYRTWRVIDVRSAVSTVEFIRDAKQKAEVIKLTRSLPVDPTKPLIGRSVCYITFLVTLSLISGL